MLEIARNWTYFTLLILEIIFLTRQGVSPMALRADDEVLMDISIRNLDTGEVVPLARAAAVAAPRKQSDSTRSPRCARVIDGYRLFLVVISCCYCYCYFCYWCLCAGHGRLITPSHAAASGSASRALRRQRASAVAALTARSALL